MSAIGFICPTYKARELDPYTRLALSSFFATTPAGVAIVVDDGSEGWNKDYENSLSSIAANYSNASIRFVHFPTNGGVTRSWNAGLLLAEKLKLDYVVAGNNDVIFTNYWYEGMLHAIDNGFHLVGPLSNAPGDTARGLQQVECYLDNFKLTDDQTVLNTYAAELKRKYADKIVEKTINGFFQFAAMSSWISGKYDSLHYYCPANYVNSKGKRNPTPFMTLNEDELQQRWHRKKMRSAIAPSSFIFHYRAVTRGKSYCRGNWYRIK